MSEDISEKEKFHIQVLLEEYRALRAEILQSMQNRNSILTFGSAILGAIASATALSAKSLNNLAILMIGIVAVPLLCLCTVNFWMAETIRIVRAAVYIKEHIEAKINGYLGDTLLWESYIRVPRGEKCPIKNLEIAQLRVDDIEQVFYLFSGITCLSFLGAVVYVLVVNDISIFEKYLLLSLTAIAAVIIYVLFRSNFMKKVKTLVKHLRPYNY